MLKGKDEEKEKEKHRKWCLEMIEDGWILLHNGYWVQKEKYEKKENQQNEKK